MQKRLESRRLLRVKIPEALYFELRQTSMFTKRRMSDMVALGIRHVLRHGQFSDAWPREYYKKAKDFDDSAPPVKGPRVIFVSPKPRESQENPEAQRSLGGTTQAVSPRTRAETPKTDE